MLDVSSKKAIDAKYTNGTYSDCRGAHDLLKEVNNVSVLHADGAYDTRHIYQLYLLNKFTDIGMAKLELAA